MDGRPFKIIAPGSVAVAPSNTAFRAFRPTGITEMASIKGKTAIDTGKITDSYIVAEFGCDDIAGNGDYSTGAYIDCSGLWFNICLSEIDVNVGSNAVIAWYW